jgi:hypothetical protein
MSNVDEMLLKVRNAPVPAALAGLEVPVMEAIAAGSQPAGGLALSSTALAAVAALAVGVLGAVPGDNAEAAPASFALGEVSSLAPSSLLAGN